MSLSLMILEHIYRRSLTILSKDFPDVDTLPSKNSYCSNIELKIKSVILWSLKLDREWNFAMQSKAT